MLKDLMPEQLELSKKQLFKKDFNKAGRLILTNSN